MTADEAFRKAVILGPGEGRAYPMGRIGAVFKADGLETESRYSISEWWLAPHTQGPGAHSHPEDDVFYVIEGTVSVLVGEEWTHAPKGSFVLVPGGVTHDFENRGDVRAGVLNLSIPGPFEPHMPGIVRWFTEHPPGDPLAHPLGAGAEGEIVSRRVFDAPREVVFRAFSDPGVLARWWGPTGFTTTFHEFDLRPGGAWRCTMHGPDGKHYRNASDFVEVVTPERIVFQHVKPAHRFLMTMTFADEAGRTRLTWRMRFESREAADKVKEYVPEANEQNFDRLESVLAGGSSGAGEVGSPRQHVRLQRLRPRPQLGRRARSRE